MIHGVTPVLGVSDSRAAEEFYCGKLGFELQFAYRPLDHDDPCHMGVKRDHAVMRVSTFSGDGVSVIIWTRELRVRIGQEAAKGSRYTSAMTRTWRHSRIGRVRFDSSVFALAMTTLRRWFTRRSGFEFRFPGYRAPSRQLLGFR